MAKANKDIRRAITDNGLRMWQVADAYGICDGNFSRLLRHELPQETKAQILEIISKLCKEA